MKLFFLIIFPLIGVCGFKEINSDNLYNYQIKEKKARFKKTPKKDERISNLANKLIKGDQKLIELLSRQEKKLIVRKKNNYVRVLSRVEGVVLNSILAMNVKPSKFIVRLGDDNEELEGAQIRCLGHSFEKRVISHCNLLVLEDKEFEVDIDIWDLDGAEGIISDYFYSGEEKTFLTSSFASFLQGIINAGKDRVTTPFGDTSRINAKNQLLGGLSNIAGNVRSKIVESGEKNLTISYVNSGKRVLVFFNKTLNLNKEKSI